MRQILLRIVAITLCVAVWTSAIPAWAGELGRDEALRHEGFLRGGRAIAAALNDAVPVEPLVSPEIAETMPPSPLPVPRQTAGGGSKVGKLGWGALIAGFAVSGVLIYKYATGPGASIRNCSTCK